MGRRISLDGAWGARGCEPGAGEAAGWGEHGFEPALSAQVPGQVQRDLVREGIEPDFDYGENARGFARLEGTDWWFAREFELDAAGGRAELCFHGLDAHADAWLNGEHLGRHVGAHAAWTCDATALLRAGANRLVVRVDDGARHVLGKEIERYRGSLDSPILAENMRGPLGGDFPVDYPGGLPGLAHDHRIWVRKPVYVWGWDWAPHLLTCGIWRGVELLLHDAVALRDVQLVTQLGEDGGAVLEAACEVECFGGGGASDVEVELTLAGESGTHRASVQCSFESGRHVARLRLELAQPALWWPAPLGRPHLYDCTLTARSAAGSDERRFRHGLRTVALDRRPRGEEGESFTFVVNGMPVYCKGSNWHPPELLFGCVEDDKLARLIELAADGNVNMLRVNGVGTYESERFYDLCDEHGILVWQDFPLSATYYPDDDAAFCETVRAEAEQAIRRLRNRASLALWCGNNESQWHHALEQRLGVAKATRHGQRLYDEILPQACAALDAGRPYLPGDPIGGEFPNSDLAGTRHVWEYQFFRRREDRVHFEDHELDRSPFVSEFGVNGPSERSTLESFAPPEQAHPGSPVWEFHNNLLEAGLTQATIERWWAPVEALELDDFLTLGQLFQGEALAHAIRHWRRRKFRTSGVLSWDFADCWGTSASWSLVDYRLRPRAAYFHVKRAFEPLHVSLQRVGDRFAAWVVNDRAEAREATLELGFADLERSERLAQTSVVTAPANGAAVVSHLELPSEVRAWPARFVAYATLSVDGRAVSRARETLVGFEYRRLELPAPRVDVTRTDGGVELRAETYVFGLHLAIGDAVPGDNHFDLLPGEVRTIDIPRAREREVACWCFGNARTDPTRASLARIEAETIETQSS